MIAIRGATTITEDTLENVREAAIELIAEIIKENELNKNDLISIIFSCTNDIKSTYPGKHIREYFGLDKIALMHFNEMEVNNGLKKCIRVMLLVNINKNDNIKYIYLRKAKSLRQDLIN
jgi:chorismate mutase